MFDYNAQYRRLRETGARGWAGDQHERGVAQASAMLDRLMRETCFPPPPARVLELGCGNGLWALLMARKDYRAFGVDIAELAIEWARERFGEARLPGDFTQGDVCSMPFYGDAMFDIVADGACLHCLLGDQRAQCLAEVRRVLRPGGVFIVSSMCGLPKSDGLKQHFDPETEQLRLYGRPYRTLKQADAIDREVAEAGFTIVMRDVADNAWWDHLTLLAVAGATPH